MATLAADISASERRLKVDDPDAPRQGARYRIGDEVITLVNYYDGAYVMDGSVQRYEPDPTCWYVDRGADGSLAVEHSAGATVTLVSMSDPGETPTLAAVLAQSDDADGGTITNLAAPSAAADAATKGYVDDNFLVPDA